MSLVLLVLGASAAWAPKTLTLPVVDGPCSSARQSGYLLGEFAPTRFVHRDGELWVRGDMNGTCDLPTDDATLTDARARADAQIVTSDCRILVLELGDGRARGVSYDLEGDLMVFESDEDDALLCRIAAAQNQPRKLVPLLNALVEETA